MVICPCSVCRNVDRHLGSEVVYHLVTRGMDEDYKRRRDWYHHGEVISGDAVESKVKQWNDEVLGLYRAAEYLDEELASKGSLVDYADGEEEDKEEDEFLAKLADAETPLYPSCANHSKLSAIVSLYRIKTKNGWSDKSFNDNLETLPNMLPEDNVLHTSMYDVKKFLKSFDMGYQKIHACINDCCLFRKKYKKLDACPKCKASRWKTNMHTGQIKKGVPQKVLRYFPVIPRLKRMFRSEQQAKDLRWHFSNKSSDGKMRHPVDYVTWEQVNAKYPEFAAEERNIRLGLSTNGFNLFNMKNSWYSCWPVLLVNYNMAPDLCMKKENMMLTLLIPGPQQPGNSIDIYLEPLIEDLNHLWSNGEVTYDAFSKTTFNLKAILLWTISDFPAYGNLARCKVKGKMGCPLCGKSTDSMWLRNCRKHVYMCHRKSLPPNHRNDFGNRKETGKKRSRTASVIETASSDESDDSELDEEEEGEKDDEELSRWKKRSIFFKLSYWEDLPVRHNLDVMHVERNVCASIVATLLHCGKSKDGLKTQKDLQILGIRKDLHPAERGKRTYLPPAPWSLSKSEKKVFCKRLYDFKGPDGYCSNISTCISLEECKVMGLKSHDYHVLMQQLLPVAIRGLLPKGPRIAILRLCAFFNQLCQRVIDMEVITVLETEVVETFCMFERFFPPSFFDIMVHLCVHLGREARLGGPVHFRWMYPFERYMKVLKDFVRNPARPEGCIAESYLAKECMEFCSAFLRKSTNVEEKSLRNTEYENNSILEGRPIAAASSLTLTEMEKKIAHLSVIQNTEMFDPYVDMHIQHLQDSNGRCRRDASIPLDSDDHEDTLKWLAYGPRNIARSYTGYIVNGLRFHTTSVDRLSQNSGVYYEATTMCRSSAKDTSHVVDWVSYYGRLTDIILLDYNVFYVPIFRCQWAVRGNGVKIEDGFTLVNLFQSQVSFARDPYILASQAKQVFYSREDDSSNWFVAMRGPSRRYNEEAEDLADVGPLPSDIDMVTEELSDESQNARTDCEGIYANKEDNGGKFEETTANAELPADEEAVIEEDNEVHTTTQETEGDTVQQQPKRRRGPKKIFELDGEYEKAAVIKNMGYLWRSYKSRLVQKVITAKNIADRMKLRPKNVPIGEWRKFVKLKTSPEFQKQESSEPSQVTRLKVWVKSRTKKDGTAVNTQAAETIRKANELAASGDPSSTSTNPKEDLLSQVLGPDKPGRLRAMGRGMSMSKLACFQVKNKYVADMQKNQYQLQKQVQDLQEALPKLNHQRPTEPEIGENSTPICVLHDWSGTDDIVAEGIVLSSDRGDFIDNTPLGPGAYKSSMMMYYQTTLIQRVVFFGVNIDTPAGSVSPLQQSTSTPAAPVKKTKDNSQSNSQAPTQKSQQSIHAEKIGKENQKCMLMDITGLKRVVAQGRWSSNDPNMKVHFKPLGPNGVRVWVDALFKKSLGASRAAPSRRARRTPRRSRRTKIGSPIFFTDLDKIAAVPIRSAPRRPPRRLGGRFLEQGVAVVRVNDAEVWRPSDAVECMEDALGTTVAWPRVKVVLV
ncbi:Transposase-associated domain [Arabidopsis thaliana x Arabidopsis arenosa]|uniref:Transposase-associated domain n=1 Tax=Arabidopsis thaliana x Arabidopsis arenosa TaxID=1240361 RepID=A0A8T1Z2V1_9BRAS|nr:Transposase-associated domain [Arabidopsis thaliana x Arabidopsis arenosa]